MVNRQERVAVAVHASDPVVEAGLRSQLGQQENLDVVAWADGVPADVLVSSSERLSKDQVLLLRKIAAETPKPVVLVVSQIAEEEVMIAVECGVVAVLPRSLATGDRLAHAVEAAAAGGAVLPPSVLGDLLKHVQRLQQEVLNPMGLNAAGLTTKEVDVLRLMADGLDTAEIANVMCYSERSVKHIIHCVTRRLNLKNRPHAVAYAVRAGII